MEKRQTSRVEKVRPAKACNTCRRKKVKCDGKRPICSSCNIFKLPCGFEDTTTGTQSRRSNRLYVEELEQRVKRMDDELKRLGRGDRSSQQTTHNSITSQTATNSSEHPGPDRLNTKRRERNVPLDPSSPDEETSLADTETSDQPSYVLRSQDGKMRFFGASSGFGVHCGQDSKNLDGSHQKPGWEHAVRRSAIQWPLTNWVPRILQDNFEQRTTQKLPSKETTMLLVGEFLSHFNHTIPIVDETSLVRLAERQFSWNPDDSPSSWVLLNVVLAFAYRERAQASSDAEDDWQKSLGHVKNALNVLVDLFLRNADLPAVQGLLGLAIYFQGTPNAQALFMLAASAMRLSHSIGLHRNTTSGFTPAEIEERRRTFWVAFILDADISLRVGRPPVQDMEDYNTPLPAESPHDSRGIISVNGNSINLFRQLAQFATVQRLVYRHLQTVTAGHQSKDMAYKSARDCEVALLQWSSSTPDIFQPERIFASEPSNSREHLLRLNLAYHCCYASLRQLPLAPLSTNGSFNETQSEVDRDIAALRLRSIDSARSALVLLPYVRLLPSNYQWNVVYFFATASVALSSELHTHSARSNSTHDLSMIHEATTFLAHVANEEPGTFVDFILSVCSDLEQSARRLISQAQTNVARPAADAVSENITNTDTVALEQQQPARYVEQGVFNGSDNFTGSYPDLFIAQGSAPPFWNLQDIFTGVPLSPEWNK